MVYIVSIPGIIRLIRLSRQTHTRLISLTLYGEIQMASTTFSGPVTSTNGFIGDITGNVTGNVTGNITGNIAGSGSITHATTSAINATATATAAQVATGYITSTSAAATAITLPTGTLLGAALGAVRGTVFDLYVDNTAGASTITMVVAVNGILSSAAADTAGSFGDLTIAAGATGIARFTLMFASATAYTFTRTA
jgi:hypothetical protein